MITRFWDDERACFAYGEVIFSGLELPKTPEQKQDEERFWSQKQPMLGGGKKEIGKWPTVADGRRVKDLPPPDVQQSKRRPQRVTCSKCWCGRRRPKGREHCRMCEAKGCTARRRYKARKAA